MKNPSVQLLFLALEDDIHENHNKALFKLSFPQKGNWGILWSAHSPFSVSIRIVGCCLTNTTQFIADGSQIGFQCWTCFDSLNSNFSTHSHKTSRNKMGQISKYKNRYWQVNKIFKISKDAEEPSFTNFWNQRISRQVFFLSAVLL